MKKNVAGQKIGAQMCSATDGSAFTGAVTVYVTGDAGTQAVGSVGSGACTHEGNGYHTYAPAQAETNYDLVAFTFIGTGAIPASLQVFTAFPQTGDSYAEVANGTYGLSAIETLVDGVESTLGTPAGASVSADIAAVKSDTAATLLDTGTDGVVVAAASKTGYTLSAAGVQAVWDALTSALTTAGSVGKKLADWVLGADNKAVLSSDAHTGAVIPTVTTTTDVTNAVGITAAAVDAIWDEPTVGHATAGTTGKALTDASSAGDPWSTALPGAYGAGTAGKIIGDNINAAVSSRASQTSVDTLTGYVDTEVAAIKAKTDNLPAAPAATGDIPTATAVADAVWDEAIAGHLSAGSTGEALNAAGAAGDPWTTTLPGAYGAGSAGYVVGNTLDAAISSRLATAGYTAPDNATIAAVQADTNDIQARLPAALVGGRIDASVGATATDAITASALATDAVTEIVTAVWSDTLTTYTDGQAGKRLKGVSAVPFVEGAVNDAAATTTTFISNLVGYGDAHFVDALLMVELAADQWQARPVTAYVSATGAFTVDEPFLSPPANGVSVAVKVTHIHPVSQIQSGLSTLDAAGVRTAVGMAAANLDTQLSAALSESQSHPTLAEIEASAVLALGADTDAIKAVVDEVLVDTAELQADLTNGGRLDLILDAINAAVSSTGAVLTTAERTAIADALLDRDMATGTDSGSPTVRTVRQALRASRNKVSISGGVLTVTKEDDATASWAATVTTTAGDPISGIDPA